jgi:hypothetical protein
MVRWAPTDVHVHELMGSEATTSKPLLYARGWGKKQAFCL